MNRQWLPLVLVPLLALATPSRIPAAAADAPPATLPPALAGYDPSGLIRFGTLAQAEAKRQELIRFIWTNGFPDRLLPNVTTNLDSKVFDGDLSGLDRNLASSADRLDCEVAPYDYHELCYLVRPLKRNANNRRLVILNSGHRTEVAFTYGVNKAANRLLAEGFCVLMTDMPRVGFNRAHRLTLPGGASVTLTQLTTAGHDELFAKLGANATADGAAFRFFLEPAVLGINYFMQATPGAADVSMLGLSGGGWMTHLCAAVDPRIKLSFPVAGSLPIYARPFSPGSGGDAEQEYPPLFLEIVTRNPNHIPDTAAGVASWLEIYALGGLGAGRRQIQVLNLYDSCCFSGGVFQTYTNFVSSVVGRLGAGAWGFYSDASHHEHQISSNVLERVVMPLLLPGNHAPGSQTNQPAHPASPPSGDAPRAERWTAERALAWYDARPWLVGCNFLPSTAVNDVEMWQPESFDPKTIDRELGWAQDLGFNTVRVFLNYAVWESRPEGLKQTFSQFLEIAHRHGLSTMPILFDDCFKPEPTVGPQPAPEPGVHNSQWVQSPGERRRGDPAAWPKLENYVKDMVGAFAGDDRVLAWELYNEPTASLPLVEAAFKWAREAHPTQPLTTTIYGSEAMRRRILELSDVLSFHEYGPLPGLKAEADRLRAQGRPLLCTEWMARTPGSRFESHLPYLKQARIACWSWGLVAGRTQTYFAWNSPKGAPEPVLWHHDILRADGSPYRSRETDLIKVMTGKLPASAMAKRTVVVPTAEATPLPCRYTLEKPADGWFKPGFDDSSWQPGLAPFGQEELPIGRKPNTVWTSADIWLRRDFDLPDRRFADLQLLIHYDEDAEVYINGVLALKAPGYNAAYEPFDFSPEALAVLKPGRNQFAVHCRQTVGGQYIDLGIEGVAKAN